jgi:hypothetical protein
MPQPKVSIVFRYFEDADKAIIAVFETVEQAEAYILREIDENAKWNVQDARINYAIDEWEVHR